MSAETPLGQVKGLGSARSGTMHFWHQRITAVALLPLAIWFVRFAFGLVGADQWVVTAFLSQPFNAVMMFLFLVAALYHMSLGLQVIIEDYVHDGSIKVALLMCNRFFAWVVGAAAVFALLKIALGQ